MPREHHRNSLKRGERGRLLPLDISAEQVIAQLQVFLQDLPENTMWGVKTIRMAPGGLYDRLNKYFPKEVGKRGAVNWQAVCDQLDAKYVERFAAKGVVINNKSLWSEHIKDSNRPKLQQQVVNDLLKLLKENTPWSPGIVKNLDPNLYDRILNAFPDSSDRWKQVKSKLPQKLQDQFFYIQDNSQIKYTKLINLLTEVLLPYENPVRLSILVAKNIQLRGLLTSFAPRRLDGQIDWDAISAMLEPDVAKKLIKPAQRLQLSRLLFQGIGAQALDTFSPSTIMKLPKRRVAELSKLYPHPTLPLDFRTLYRAIHPDLQAKWKITKSDLEYLMPRKWYVDINCTKIKSILHTEGLLPYRKSLFKKSVFDLSESEIKVLGVLFDEVANGNSSAFDVVFEYISLQKNLIYSSDSFSVGFSLVESFASLPAIDQKQKLLLFILYNPQKQPLLRKLFESY